MTRPRTGGKAEEVAGLSAEGWFRSLDPIGWRFGLERITALVAALGEPQRSFESIHVVGTNGKSSVSVMTAALLEASGRSTGAYLSPHVERWAERVQIRGSEIEGEAFAQAAAKVAAAIPGVEEGFSEGERVTQFEAATAVAFVALADAGVEVGVIEAGLGGRLDATNVLNSKATVLTSIGLDHTAWLGETEAEIAAEKLAVLRPGSTLVLGGLSPEVEAQARSLAAARDCRVAETHPRGETSNAPRYRGAIGTFGGGAPYLQRNLAVARAAAVVVAGPLDDEVVQRAIQGLELRGRFEVSQGDPPVISDAAHNPHGATALAEALGAELGERHVIACIALMGDKDAAGIVKALAPALSSVVCTEIPLERLRGAGRPGTSTFEAVELASLFEVTGVAATVETDPDRAIALAKERAKEQGGVALIAGSHYLLA
ncbi:MAG: dihydrofolate synthase [Actinomycetota bacterium]|nr:dihydrofolate synthase [Actinomycetota bacterium]